MSVGDPPVFQLEVGKSDSAKLLVSDRSSTVNRRGQVSAQNYSFHGKTFPPRPPCMFFLILRASPLGITAVVYLQDPRQAGKSNQPLWFITQERYRHSRFTKLVQEGHSTVSKHCRQPTITSQPRSIMITSMASTGRIADARGDHRVTPYSPGHTVPPGPNPTGHHRPVEHIPILRP